MPEDHDIERLKVGDLAPFVFGMAEVTEIYARKVDIHGAPFVCYYVKHGSHNGTMSASMKVGEIIRSFPACDKFNSAELDTLEKEMRTDAGIMVGRCRADGHFITA